MFEKQKVGLRCQKKLNIPFNKSLHLLHFLFQC